MMLFIVWEGWSQEFFLGIQSVCTTSTWGVVTNWRMILSWRIYTWMHL